MEFPKYIVSSERAVSVIGVVPVDEKGKPLTYKKEDFIDNKGYIYNDGVWIYCINGKPKNQNEYPYFWLDDNGKIVLSDPEENMRDRFSINNIADFSIVNIINTSEPDAVLFDENEIININNASDSSFPLLSSDDDFLKKIVKTTIIEKGINLNKLKNKTEKPAYSLSNMRSAMNGKTKMSVMYFDEWMSLLGCDFEILVYDNKRTKTDKLAKPLVYLSNKNVVCEKNKDDSLTELNTGLFSDKEDD